MTSISFVDINGLLLEINSGLTNSLHQVKLASYASNLMNWWLGFFCSATAESFHRLGLLLSESRGSFCSIARKREILSTTKQI
jgi:hypothetical protein